MWRKHVFIKFIVHQSLLKSLKNTIMSFSVCVTKSNIRAINCEKPYLFVGTGHQLIILKCSQNAFNELLLTKTVFQNIVITGISSETQINHLIIAVYGNRFLKIYKLIVDDSSDKNILISECLPSRNFHDWIIDVKIQNDFALIVRAHNDVILFNWKTLQLIDTHYGIDKCILYSSHLLCTELNAQKLGFVLASGTVFKEIVIWSSNSDKCIDRLKGHDGVIFAINYNSELNLLVSASDDRSVRVWKGSVCSPHSIQSHDENKFTISNIFYGHDSRIWSVHIITKPKPIVISAGEDSSLCFWDINENALIEKERSHKNSSIWCLDIDCESLIAYTGCSDACITVWDINNILTPITSIIKSNLNPKAISLFSCGDQPKLFTSTNDGDFLIIPLTNDLESDTLKLNNQNKDLFRTYCALDINEKRDKLVLGSKCGQISIIDLGSQHENYTILNKKLFDGKVFSVCFVSCEQFVSCGNKGIVKVCDLKDFYELGEYQLPVSRHRWPTAGLLFNEFLILGDRCGNIFIYLNNENKQPINTYRSLHGRNGVTCINWKPNSDFMYSSGRNGKIYEFVLRDRKCIQLRAFRIFSDVEWIGKMIFDKFTGDLSYVLGFESRNFVVWNEMEQRFMYSIDCGGGHRSWDFAFVGQSMYFSFIKQDQLICYSKTVSNFTSNKSLSILKPFHSKKINCCAILLENHFSDLYSYFATAGEDNIIHINRFDKNSHSVFVEHVLYGHISNISSLSTCSTNLTSICYLVSVGGRSQLILWKLEIINNSVICQQIINDFFSCEDMPEKPHKTWTSISDTQIRYLDSSISFVSNDKYLISTACSDFAIRLFIFDESDCILNLVKIISTNNSCVLRITNLFKYRCIVSASTNGILKFWRLPQSFEQNLVTLANSDISSHCEVKRHQSGINAIDVYCISENMCVIASGGDDNCLSLSLFKIIDSCIDCIACAQEKHIHSSQITGIKFLSDDTLISSSIDERIVAWKWKHACDDRSSHSLIVTPIVAHISSIADASSLCIIDPIAHNSRKSRLLVCGEGFEILNYNML